ncbi:MAG: hypothetical protein LHW55_06995 [Candidatus Cloacimonetes bacterium]|nr:hypothetical protein [Candidatus Cloacimonadota bacterium]
MEFVGTGLALSEIIRKSIKNPPFFTTQLHNYITTQHLTLFHLNGIYGESP